VFLIRGQQSFSRSHISKERKSSNYLKRRGRSKEVIVGEKGLLRVEPEKALALKTERPVWL
jgi:hypothetical protein